MPLSSSDSVVKFGKKIRDAVLDQLLGRGKLAPPALRLCVYDDKGKRRYWMPLPPVMVSDGRVTVADIPILDVDESFTFGWLQIDDENGGMLAKLDVTLSTKHLHRGETLKISGLTLTID